MIHGRLATARPIAGWAWVGAAGLAYAALMHWLAVNGDVPSATAGLPVEAESYYGVARFYVVPLLLLGAFIFSRVTARVGGIDPTPGLAFAYGAPLLLAFVVPDLVGYGIGGHELLGRLLRVTAPLTALGIVANGAFAVRAKNGSRAVLAAVLGLFAQAIFVAPLLR